MIARLVSLFITVSSLSMAARMILPLFVEPESSKLYFFSCILSEPIVAPVRAVFDMIGLDDSMPIDLALPSAYILLFIIRLFLPEL